MFAPGSSIQPQADRRWWPDAYLDETMPKGRTTPDAWLFRLYDGLHQCGCAPRDDGTSDGFDPFTISEGDVVEFSPCDDHGLSVLTIDGDNHCFAPALPEGASFWVKGEPCTFSDDPDQFVASAIEHAGDDQTLDVRVVVWGDSVRLRFTALDGPPRFVVAEATEADRG